MITINTSEINTKKDVKFFFRELMDNDINFHPDDSFSQIIDWRTDEKVFSDTEAERLDSLMATCFDVCQSQDGNKVYQIAITEFKRWEKKNVKPNKENCFIN